MVDVHDLVVRLRDEASRMPAASQQRSLLREAASTIEALDHEARRQAIEAARLNARLARAAS